MECRCNDFMMIMRTLVDIICDRKHAHNSGAGQMREHRLLKEITWNWWIVPTETRNRYLRSASLATISSDAADVTDYDCNYRWIRIRPARKRSDLLCRWNQDGVQKGLMEVRDKVRRVWIFLGRQMSINSVLDGPDLLLRKGLRISEIDDDRSFGDKINK